MPSGTLSLKKLVSKVGISKDSFSNGKYLDSPLLVIALGLSFSLLVFGVGLSTFNTIVGGEYWVLFLVILVIFVILWDLR